jgi:predicted amidohydrolase YtcJ
VNAAEHADFIFVNGNIHTVNERQRHAEAVAVKDQRIVFLGSNEDAKR